MKWVKRGLWAAAWGCWFWLGFGLYRELPRDLGPPVAQIALDDDELMFGFAIGKNFVVTRRAPETGQQVFRFWNARTGCEDATTPPLLVRDAWTTASMTHLVEGPQDGKLKSSADGRTALDVNRQTLCNLETKQVLYAGGEAVQTLWDGGGCGISYVPWLLQEGGRDCVGSREVWEFRAGAVATWRTWLGVRSLADASLRYRLFSTPAIEDPMGFALKFSGDGTLCADPEGNIYELPPRANYPLLALCQTILALPLVMLWAVLRWRRKRRMWIAGAAL